DTSSHTVMFGPKTLLPTRLLRKERWSRMAIPPKSQNMKPTRSSTAAGSRMTVYLPAGSSRGLADCSAFLAAVSASATGFRLRMSGELAFCQPEESPPSMVTEISDEVCVWYATRPREFSTASTDSELE